MNRGKCKILSIGIMAIATAFMIFEIWSENISWSTRPFIVLGYLVLMTVAVFLRKILRIK